VLLLNGAAIPQTISPLAKTTDVWMVFYHVSVTGDFSKEPAIGEDGPSVFYHINRTYDGKATLTYLPRDGDPKAAAVYPQFKDPESQIHIVINDLIRRIYPVVCDAYQSKEESWTADVDSLNGVQDKRYPALLKIFNDQLRYKTSFPILYFEIKKPGYMPPITHKTEEFTNPGLKKTKSNTEYIGFATHQFPKIKGYIEHDSIMRDAWWAELNDADGAYSWLSPILHPDEPVIYGVPESKDKVNILIHYSFTKVKR
jgi:hypothetical protein